MTTKCHYWLKNIVREYNSTTKNHLTGEVLLEELPDVTMCSDIFILHGRIIYSTKFVSHAEEPDLSKYNICMVYF